MPESRDVQSNPQAEQMSHESMVRTLLAQAEAIWPQERTLFDRYVLPARPAILDIGCGTGEITARLAWLYPDATLLGVDLDTEHLERARHRNAAFGGRVRFEPGDALALHLPAASFDLVVCRHLVQAVPDPARVLAEMARVARPGGRLHVLAEDYGMMHFHPTVRDMDHFWKHGVMAFGRAIGTDQAIGRKLYTLLSGLGLADITVDYVIVDTLRVDREVFARIWTAWRDGYADGIAEKSGLPRAEVWECWDQMLACIRDPRGYGVWQVPVWGARVP